MEIEKSAVVVLPSSLIKPKFHYFMFTVREIALNMFSVFKTSKRFSIRVPLLFFPYKTPCNLLSGESFSARN